MLLYRGKLFDITGERGSGLTKDFDYDIESMTKIDPDLILYAESADAIATGFDKARAISVGPDGLIYVAGDEAVKIFDGEGMLLRTVATDGEAVVESVEPQTTAVTPSPAEPVTYAMAEAAYFAGDYVEAVTLFEHYSEEHPENAWGFYMLGLSLRKDDNLEAAEDAFAAALELKPEHSKSLVNLARVLLELDRAGEALPLVEQVVQNEVHNVAALRVLGRVHDNLDHRAEAIAAYEAALRVDRDDAWSLNNLGLLYIEAERFDQALAPLARACQLDDQVACFQNNLGVALERSGHAGAAQAAFSAAVTADPGYAKAIASRDRLAAVDGTDQLDEVDLVALADGFQVEPVLAADETTAAAAEGSEEIAALVPATATSASAELEEKR